MRTLHAVVRLSGLVRKANGKLFLTKRGLELIASSNREKLFQHVLYTFTREFDWSYNDGYPDFSFCGEASGFSIYLLSKFGDKENSLDFYSRKFLNAFPMSTSEFQSANYSSATDMFSRCYQVRTFSRFFEWFSLTNYFEETSPFSEKKAPVRKSDLFDQVFEVQKH